MQPQINWTRENRGKREEMGKEIQPQLALPRHDVP
jgi:hypothetical protein